MNWKTIQIWHELCHNHFNDTFFAEDLIVGNCLASAGVPLLSDRGANGHRFHIFSMDIPAEHSYEGWFHQYTEDNITTYKWPDCCDPYPILFHYVNSTNVRIYHKFFTSI